MVWSTETYTDNIAPTVNDVATNALVSEHSNIVSATNQTPDQSITNQIGKASAILASGAVDQYTMSGSASAYIATPIAPVTPIAPTALFTGMRIRGVISVTNGGGALTINPNGIGATPVKLVDGTDPVAGDLLITQQIDFFYDGTNFVVTTTVPSLIAAGVPVATNVEMEAGVLNNVFVTPLNFIQSSLAIKSWIQFDGEPVVPTFVGRNIVSLVRIGGNGSGTYDVTFTNAFLTTNYVATGTSGGPGAGFDNRINTEQISTTVCRITSFTPADVLEDSQNISVIFVGDI